MNKIVGIAMLLVLYSAPIWAQHKLSGTISDEQSIPLEQVSVYFPLLEKGTVTNEQGEYSFRNLPEGTYTLIISYLGYQTRSQEVRLGSVSKMDFALSPTAIEMDEVIVSTPFHKLQKENVVKVERANMADLKAKGAMTLTEGISKIPGVESVSTGTGIGKPVIRGLSGNRVVVYTQGIRLENQQYGDEHGLGLSGAGISSIEVIKGPASLLYGSDAMGGVLYLNPESFAPAGNYGVDLNMDYYGNTGGRETNVGFQTSGEKFKFLLRGSTTSHTDYKTGDGERVTNSRFNGYDLKSGIGYHGSNFTTELRYNYNNTLVGLPETIGEQSRERHPELPYQKIQNHILSSKSKFFFDRSNLTVILGYTGNLRQEFEDHHHHEDEDDHDDHDHEDHDNDHDEDHDGHEDHGHGDEAALDMDLNTFSYNVQYQFPKWKNMETVIGGQGMVQTNTNHGEEVLIPNASTTDAGVMGTSHIHFNDNNDLQLGVRIDSRWIDSEAHGDPADNHYIAPLTRDFISFNASAGYKTNLSTGILLRANLASGFRAPNLAELTSNGSHEGTNRFEIGDPNLNSENNFQLDLALEYHNKHVEFYANGFYNYINDYIYLQPDGSFIDNDPVYRYQQDNAYLYGGEFGLHFHPHPLDWLHLESSFETVTGKTVDGDYLALIPANAWENTLRVEGNPSKGYWEKWFAFATLESVMDQNKIAPNETPTEGYNLFHIGMGTSLRLGQNQLEVDFGVNNLFNTNYMAHLSRLKPDGIANMGRNIHLGLRYKL